MARGLYVILGRWGIPFKQIGPEQEYHGLRAPYALSIRDLEMHLEKKNPDLIALARQKVEDSVRDIKFCSSHWYDLYTSKTKANPAFRKVTVNILSHAILLDSTLLPTTTIHLTELAALKRLSISDS